MINPGYRGYVVQGFREVPSPRVSHDVLTEKYQELLLIQWAHSWKRSSS